MMKQISVVIITKDEAHIIGKTLDSVRGISVDIIIVDSGSSDGTLEIAADYTTNILKTTWKGYGPTKNLGIDRAKYDWILTLDADEVINETLKESLLALDLQQNENIIYKATFRNYIGDKYLKYGRYLKGTSTILFNRKRVKWNSDAVHEKLVVPSNSSSQKLKGLVHHFAMKDLTDYTNKMVRYAQLNAQKYFDQGRTVSTLKLLFAGRFAFIRNFLLRGGFLDGRMGFVAAVIYSYYVFLKYARLKELTDLHKK
jgi:glycosyltransferase involved in cell wall biosynthesis